MTVPKFDGNANAWIEAAIRYLEEREAQVLALVRTGTVIFFASDTSPDGYLLCDGEEYNLADYPALGKELGDQWGTASATDKFLVPDVAPVQDLVAWIKT